MASILGSQGVVLATAMAVSSTVILLAFRLQKSIPSSAHQFPLIRPINPEQALRSCISTDGKGRSSEKKKKKKVKFAEDVVDPIGYSKEFRRQQGLIISNSSSSSSSISTESSSASPKLKETSRSSKARGIIPANRMALYNGILKDRVGHQVACSY